MSRQPQSMYEATLPYSVNSENADSQHQLQQKSRWEAMSTVGKHTVGFLAKRNMQESCRSCPPAKNSHRRSRRGTMPGTPYGIQVTASTGRGFSNNTSMQTEKPPSHREGLKRPSTLTWRGNWLPVIFPLQLHRPLLPFHSSKFLNTGIWWGMEETITHEAYLGYVQLG